jgi:protease I
MRILCFVHKDFEDLELWYPIYRLREEGAEVILAGESAKVEYPGKYGVPATSDIAYSDAHANDFDGLVVPGGWAPDKMRRFPAVLQITREMDQAGKPIAQICHAGWVLISAGIVKGRTMTSTPGIRDDLTNAGAIWLDASAVVDRNIVSGRRPPDLPDFMRAFIKVAETYQHSQSAKKN